MSSPVAFRHGVVRRVPTRPVAVPTATKVLEDLTDWKLMIRERIVKMMQLLPGT